MADHSLNLFSPVLLGKAPLGDIVSIASGWWRSRRWRGGPWLGGFTIYERDLSLPEMIEWFYEYLGNHIEESLFGNVVWDGQLYEMDLVINGHRKRRTLEHYDDVNSFENWIKVVYVDEDNKTQETAPWAQMQSVYRYGVFQEIIRIDGFDQTAAEARRGTELNHRSWPFARTVNLSQDDVRGNRLEVQCWGYIHTTNNRYVTTADGNKGNVSDWIRSIGDTDCEFVSPGLIRENTLQVTRSLNSDIRAFDKLMQLGKLGDENYSPWRLWCAPGRLLNYDAMSPDPIYYWDNGRILDLNGLPVHPRAVVPGVARDLNYPQMQSEPGAFLPDARDTILEEVTVDEDGKLSLQNTMFSDAEILQEQSSFYAAEERMK